MTAKPTAGTAFKRYRWPRSLIARFVARRTLKSATLWAFIFGAYTASKTLAYAKAAPTALDRAKLAHSFSNNAGLNALLGLPHNIDTVAGYAAWNTFSVVTIMGSIWAFLLATKYFRGEEESGRRELLLAGQTTAGRAAANTLAGLGVSLTVLFGAVAALYVIIGQDHTVGIRPATALFFALSVVMGSILFMVIGALSSQLMPTRSRAAGLSAVIFGIFFLLRATGDVSSARWLLDITPLGWIENLQPLTGSHPLWLLPTFGLVAACAVVTVYLASQRDLGDSTFADRVSSKPHTRLLNSTFGAALRLTRGNTLGWLIAIGLLGLFYGLLTKTATQALDSFSRTGGAGKVESRLSQSAHISSASLFLGAIFLILLPIVMSYTASALGKVRDEEAYGFLDNFLVRRVSRLQWLGQRTLLLVTVSVGACLLAALGVWVGEASQHGGVAFHGLLLAGLNMVGAVLFTVGAGILTMGWLPRLTTLVVYCVIGWSFLMEILGSGVNLNHWLLDTSVLHHVTLAPAISPNWTANCVLAGLGLLLFLAGVARFNSRDLAGE